MSERGYATAGAYPDRYADARTGSAGIASHPSALRRISWGAIIAGAVITMAVHFILSLLGLGVGLTTVDPGQAGGSPQTSTFGIGAGIWWVLSNLVALVAGGYVAARLSGLPFRGDGIIHGVVTWAVTLLITIYLLTTAVGALVGGAVNTVQNALSAAGQGISQVMPQAADSFGLSPDQLGQRAEELMRPGGPADANDPETARRDLVTALTTMATGSEQEAQQARDQAVAIIARQANIPRDQAEQRVDQVQNQIRQTASQAADTATQAADTAANATATAAIWAAITFLLGAAAGAAGGAMGTRSRQEYYD